MNDLLIGLRDAVGGGQSGLGIIIGLILVLFLVGGVALYIMYLLSPRGRMDMLLQSRQQSKRNPWPVRILAVSFIIAVPLALQFYASQPSTCVSCHTKPDYKKELAKGPHATTNCQSCHGATGVTATARESVTYARWAWAQYMEQRVFDPAKALPTQIDPSNCYDCHKDVRKGVVEANGVRVRHSDFLNQSMTCTDCHDNVSHRAADAKIKATGPEMKDCMPCHDGKTAPTACETCHVRDVALQRVGTRYGTEDKITISKGRDSCYSCHTEKKCTSCHGVRMPHPVGWTPSRDASGNTIPGGHAREGFANRDACYRCHFAPGKPFEASAQSCSCHGNVMGTMHGGKPWIKEHALEATGKKGGSASQCFICHGTNLCEYCHPASYTKLYNPTGGPDQYQRAVPQEPAEAAMVNGL